METVYVDILLLTNLIIDYFLLRLTGILLNRTIRPIRLFFGTGAAALSSLLIFVPRLSVLSEILLKISVALIVVLITFGFVCLSGYFKATALFFAANAVFAGGALCLWAVFHPRGLIVHNATVYYHLSPVVLILSCVTVYVLSRLLVRLTRRRGNAQHYSVTLRLDGRQVTLDALLDSGNLLHDSLSGAPVMICEYEKIRPLLTPELNRVFQKKSFEEGFYGDILKSGCCERFRVIPFDSVGGSGLMAALLLDSAVLHRKNEDQELVGVIMAVTHQKLFGGETGALLSPELIYT